jgi:hypothetical protein
MAIMHAATMQGMSKNSFKALLYDQTDTAFDGDVIKSEARSVKTRAGTNIRQLLEEMPVGNLTI